MKELIQALSTILALTGVYYAAHQKSIKWPIGICANILAIYVYLKAELYIKASLAIFFIINSFFGWYKWNYGGQNRNKLKISSQNKRPFVLTILLFSMFYIVTSSGVYYYKRYKNNLSEIKNINLEKSKSKAIPLKSKTNNFNIYIIFIEGLCIFSILARLMLARKMIEHWYIWIVLDTIFLLLSIYKKLYYFSFKYFVYLILAIFGLKKWKQSILNNKVSN